MTKTAAAILLILSVPASAAPPAPKKPDAAELYAAKCQACHMADGNSSIEDMNFADGKWKHGSSLAEVTRVITEGAQGTAMLPFKEQLSADEIAALAAYVRTFDPVLKAKPKTKPPAKKAAR